MDVLLEYFTATGNDSKLKYGNCLQTLIKLKSPVLQWRGINMAQAGMQLENMLADKNFTGHIMGYFNCIGNPSRFQSQIESIRTILSQHCKESELRANFISFLNENPEIKEAFSNIYGSEDDCQYFNLLMYLFNYRGQMPFLTLIEDAMRVT